MPFTKKVKKVRPRFAASIGRAFVKDEIATHHEKLERVCLNLHNVIRKVSCFLSFFDWIRFNKIWRETGFRLREKLQSEHSGKLRWLRTQRFGSEELNMKSVFKLLSLELSRAQLEVLCRGPKFGKQPKFPKKEFSASLKCFSFKLLNSSPSITRILDKTLFFLGRLKRLIDFDVSGTLWRPSSGKFKKGLTARSFYTL